MLWSTPLAVIIVEGNHGYAKFWIFVFLEIGQFSEVHQHLPSDQKIIVVTGKPFKLVIPFIHSECFAERAKYAKKLKKKYLHFLYRLIQGMHCVHVSASTTVSNIVKSCWMALKLHKYYLEIAWIISVFFSSDITTDPCNGKTPGNGWDVPSAASKPDVERLATVVQQGRHWFFQKDVDPKLEKFWKVYKKKGRGLVEIMVFCRYFLPSRWCWYGPQQRIFRTSSRCLRC